MRTILALALAALLLLVIAAPTSAGDPPTPGVPGAPAIVVGDSLAVGTEPYLDGLLPGYALNWDARSGRTTPQGILVLQAILAATTPPRAVVVSLGSNDGSSAVRFFERMRRVLQMVPADACVVWPTIVRPDRKGDETGLNRVLRRMANRDPRVVLVDWIGAVRRGTVRLPDGLHPDASGYAERSRMIAEALQIGCGPRGGASRGSGGAAAPTS